MYIKNKKSAIYVLFGLTLFFLAACNGENSSNNSLDGTEDPATSIKKQNEQYIYSPDNSKRDGINEVIVHENADLDKIHTILSTSANAGFVDRYIFENLMEIDPVTFEYYPVLAASRPLIEEVDVDVFGKTNRGLAITYEIRPEANWNNGDPITAHDVDFTLKSIKNPKTDCEHIRGYYDFIIDLKIDPENPKKFTLYCKDTYFMAEIWSAQTVFPEYHYDPEQIMRNFTVNQLSDPEQVPLLSGDPDIIRFAEFYNQEKFGREPEFINGSGPYIVSEWTTGQRVVLTKNENWWGDVLVGKETGFYNHPDKLVYEIIVDNTTAVTALKDEGLDVMRNIPSKDFIKLVENPTVMKRFNMHVPTQLSYSYIGLNNRISELSDKKVRQALSMSLDYNTILEVLLYNLAVRTVGPINPSKSYYNHDIPLYQYDLATASALLDEAGWIDNDGNGIREKEVDGEVLELNLEFMVPSGSETGEKIALLFKESLNQIGVDIEIVLKEWTVFIETIKNHDFDLYAGGWVAAPTLSDMKQIWHTQSYNGGSNYVGFGNEYTDELIEKIRYETDEAVRNEMYFEIQEIIHEEAPYIFMVSNLNKLAIHKRFEQAEGHVKRPGYQESAFMLTGASAAIPVE